MELYIIGVPLSVKEISRSEGKLRKENGLKNSIERLKT